MMGRTEVQRVVIESLRGVLESMEQVPGLVPKDIGESTVLIGEGAVLDSMRVVSLIVEVEQSIEEEANVSITIADARAMNMSSSPFRTVESLTDYVHMLIAEHEGSKTT